MTKVFLLLSIFFKEKRNLQLFLCNGLNVLQILMIMYFFFFFGF